MGRAVLHSYSVSGVSWSKAQQEALHYFIDGKNIDELANMELSDLKEWVDTVEQKLDKQQRSGKGNLEGDSFTVAFP